MRFNYLLTVLLLGLSSFSLKASNSLSYSGRLVKANGSPVTTPVNLKFELAYTTPTGIGSVLCSQQLTNVQLSNGVFHVKLDPDCTPLDLTTFLAQTPAGETVAIRVTDETANKAYSYQALYSIPFAQVSKQLSKLGANTNDVLQWDGSKWAPASLGSIAGVGTVTQIDTGTGLTGGPITSTGTISIANSGVNTAQLANGAVTDLKVAAGIARAKLANGTPNYVLMNNGSGVISEVAQLPVAQGGTGAANAADARTNLGLGSSAVFNYFACLPGEVSKFVLPGGWSCVVDNDSLDTTKLPLAGGTMTGALDMGTNAIVNVPAPTNPTDAANMAYVDAQVGGMNSSQWTTVGSDIYYDSGNVGIGTTSPQNELEILGINQPRFAIRSLNETTSDSTEIGFQVGTGANSSTNTTAIIRSTITQADPSVLKGDLRFITNGGDSAGERMIISDSGQVGIGTSSPDSKLHINTNGNTALGGITLRNASNQTHQWYLPSNAHSEFLIGSTAGIFSWKNSNGELVRINSNGNVGIGTATPGAKLEVAGQVKITGGTPGAGKVLTSDASGLATWESPAAGGISALTGDVTASGSGSVAATIANDAVTTGKILNGTILNEDLADTTIAYGKLNLADYDIPVTKLAKLNCNAGEVLTSDTTLGYRCVADNSTDSTKVPLAGGTMTGALILNADPTVALGAATKQYVDNATSGANQWSESGGNVYRSTGKVGIGTNTPDRDLHIVTTSSTYPRGFFLEQINTGVQGPLIYGGKARGTPGAKTAVSAGDQLLKVSGMAWDGGAYYFGGGMNVIASQNHSGLNHGAYITFETTAENSGPTAERMRISSSGNVGIGTTTPASMLDVAGAIKVGTDATACSATIPGAIRYNAGIVEFCNGTVWTAFLTGSGAGFSQDGNSFGADAVLGTNDNFPLKFETNGTTKMTVLANGNVGIGTTTPAGSLDVNGDIWLRGNLRQTTGAIWAGGAGYTFSGDSNTAIKNPTPAVMTFTTNNIEQVRISSSGNVGIGTTSPGQKLTVVGDGNTINAVGSGAAGYRLSTTSVNANARDWLMSTNRTAYGNLEFWVGSGVGTDPTVGASVMSMLPSGNIGIGTATPATMLDVAGAIRPGADVSPCVVGLTGAIRNNAGVIEFCNGTAWTAFLTGSAAGFGQDGNSFGADAVLGTNDNFPLRFETNGTTKMTVLTDGKVGIGTTTPTQTLDVNGVVRAQEYRSTSNGSAGSPIFKGSTGADGIFFPGGMNTMAFSTAGTEQMRITSSGNVGIGTTSPTSILDITKNQDAQTAVWVRNSSTGTSASTYLSLSNDTLTGVGRLGVHGSNNSNVPMIQNRAFYMAGATLNGMVVGTEASTPLILATNLSERMRVDGAGNVGIGTTTPGAKLEVAGQVKITGGTPGAGKVLTSDASGLATWQTAASGLGGSGTTNYVPKFTAASTLGNSRIFDDGTNVGIGTTTPTDALHVQKNSGAYNQISMINSSNGAAGLYVGAGGSLGAHFFANMMGIPANGIPTGVTGIASNNGPFAISVFGSERMRFDMSGNVGIGTSTPSTKLEVSHSDSGYDGTNVSGLFVENSGVTNTSFVFQTATTGGGKSFTVTNSGNVGIGTITPGTNTKLSVAGQIHSKSFTTTSGAIDWQNGNSGTTSFNCSSNISFANLRDGGSYTLVVTDTGTTTCNFSTTTTGDDAATVSYRFLPANGVRTASSHSLYSLQRIGNTVYVSWMTGF